MSSATIDLASSSSSTSMEYFVADKIEAIRITYDYLLQSVGKKEADQYAISELDKFLICVFNSGSKDLIFIKKFDSYTQTAKYDCISEKMLKSMLKVSVPKYLVAPSKNPNASVSPDTLADYDLFKIWAGAKGTNRTWINKFIFDPSQRPGVIKTKFGKDQETETCLNEWTGFTLDNIYQNMSQEDQEASLAAWNCVKKKFISKVICKKNSMRFTYLMNWLSCIINFPWVKTGKCIILIGPQGTGKTFLLQKLVKLFDNLGYFCAKSQYLLDRFAGHLFENRVFIGLDEARFDTDVAMDAFKSFVTNDLSIGEKKHFNAQYVKNYYNLMLSSNDEDCLRFKTLGRERRIAFFEISGLHTCDVEWFKNMDKIFDMALPAMFYYLKYEFEPQPDKLENIPDSEIMEILKSNSLSNVENFFIDCIRAKENIYVPLDDTDAEIKRTEYIDPAEPTWRIKLDLHILYQKYVGLTTESKRVTFYLFELRLKNIFRRTRDFTVEKVKVNSYNHVTKVHSQVELSEIPSHAMCEEIMREMLGSNSAAAIMNTVANTKRKLLSAANANNKKQKQKVVDSSTPSIDLFVRRQPCISG